MSPTPTTDARTDLMVRLTSRDRIRSEATIQSDVRALLLNPDLGLAEHDLDVHLETQVGDRRRIDVEVGCTVIEVKKDLRSDAVVRAATTQLAGYVTARTEQTGQRYVGILTDGLEWRAFHEVDSQLREATRITAARGSAGADALLTWLEGVLATRQGVRPLPGEIRDRLGAASSSHQLDMATLSALYDQHRDLPTVRLKRELWASLLRSALGTQFPDTDELFLEHTLLVNSAEIIAHLVLGLDAAQLAPATLLGGAAFDEAGLYGVVERDFFDWVLKSPVATGSSGHWPGALPDSSGRRSSTTSSRFCTSPSSAPTPARSSVSTTPRTGSLNRSWRATSPTRSTSGRSTPRAGQALSSSTRSAGSWPRPTRPRFPLLRRCSASART